MNRYIDAVGLNHPGVEAHAVGPDYEDIFWKSTVIDKVTLDVELVTLDADLADRHAREAIDGMKALKALVIWLAPLVGKTPAEARTEIIAIYKGL